jgi:hypothetical protein
VGLVNRYRTPVRAKAALLRANGFNSANLRRLACVPPKKMDGRGITPSVTRCHSNVTWRPAFPAETEVAMAGLMGATDVEYEFKGSQSATSGCPRWLDSEETAYRPVFA